MNKNKPKSMKLADLHVDKEFAPPQDPVFMEKYIAYEKGDLALHIIMVPAVFVVPYSLEYFPEKWTPFLPFINELRQKIEKEDFKNFPYPYVYQKGRHFVVSDDYPSYYAFVESGKAWMFCKCLGEPNHPDIKVLGGPFTKKKK